MFMSQMLNQLQSMALLLVALVVSISFHEFFHAWSAYELGDSTARDMGRLTLNPIVHFDPLGALMILFMAFSGWGIGWGKPVPVNPFKLRPNPRLGMGLTSVAGPFSNLVLATLFAIPLRLGLSLPGLLQVLLWTMVYTNVGLAIFNLIPLPPLDGFGVLQGLLATFRTRWAYDWGNKLDRLAPYGPVLLLGLLSLGWFFRLNLLGQIIGPPMEAILKLLLGS
jgi:Zn-dependent protease